MWNDMVRVVTDSASNMVKAFNLFPVAEEEDELIDEGTAGASSSSAEHEEEHITPELSQIKVGRGSAQCRKHDQSLLYCIQFTFEVSHSHASAGNQRRH